jgi:Domain of unknown function (DUF4386)
MSEPYTPTIETFDPAVLVHLDKVETGRRKCTAFLMLVFAFLIFVPLGVLGSALDWPNNLEEDAAHNLPLLLQEQSSTFWGYFIYLIYSILFFPMAYMMGRTIRLGVTPYTQDKRRAVSPQLLLDSPWLFIGNGFAAMSAVNRSIGLCRWLFAMPILAEIYVNPNSTDATKEAVEVSYEMLNGWGGGIGEILGVSIFAALWIVCMSVLFIHSNVWPSWMGYIGILVAADLAANLLEMAILDFDVGANLTISVVLLHVWIIAGAIIFLDFACLKCCLKKVSRGPEQQNGE